MNAVKWFAEAYGSFIADHPYRLLAIVVALTMIASYGNSQLKMVGMDQKSMLPGDDPVVKSMDYIGDEFGGSETALIVVELDSSQAGSDEVKDIRDPRVMRYVDVLAQKAGGLDDVTSAASSADLVKEEGRIPQSQNTINLLLGNNSQSGRYISGDYSMALVRMTLVDNYDEERLSHELDSLVEETPHPPGVLATPSGSAVTANSIKSQIAPDMEKTSRFSLLGVLVLVIFTFMSVRYGLTSLLAIALGTVWSFGLMGLIGMSLTSQTSGAASMIMGIGIDFGIQVVSRFRIEAGKSGVRRGMVDTIDAVVTPMSTTTLAALIGFRAMSMGELTVLRELASMMSLGILCCMMAALTVVPGALVLGERYLSRNQMMR